MTATPLKEILLLYSVFPLIMAIVILCSPIDNCYKCNQHNKYSCLNGSNSVRFTECLLQA